MLSNVHQRIDDYLFRGSKDSGLIALRERRTSSSTPPGSLPVRTFRSLARTAWLLLNCSWTNLLLPLVPFAIAVNSAHAASSSSYAPAVVFWLNYFTILSVVGIFRYASESFSVALPSIIRDAWNVTFGAFSLDLLVALLGLYNNQLDLVKAYIVGKIVSTLLLTLGISFIASGVIRSGSKFSSELANTLSTLLATAMFPFAILAVFPLGHSDQTSEPILVISRGSSFVLLFMYLAYQHFQKTHTVYYKSDSPPSTPSDYESTDEDDSLVSRSSHHSRHIALPAALVVMAATAVLAYYCATPLLGIILDKQNANITREMALAIPAEAFFGFCLLPLMAELGELSKILRLALRDHIDIALEVAAEVTTQTVLFNAPLLCLLGWLLDRPMSLSLGLLEVVTFSLSVWVFNYLISKGSSDYMGGAMSLGLYLVDVLAFYLGRWAGHA